MTMSFWVFLLPVSSSASSKRKDMSLYRTIYSSTQSGLHEITQDLRAVHRHPFQNRVVQSKLKLRTSNQCQNKFEFDGDDLKLENGRPKAKEQQSHPIPCNTAQTEVTKLWSPMQEEEYFWTSWCLESAYYIYIDSYTATFNFYVRHTHRASFFVKRLPSNARQVIVEVLLYAMKWNEMKWAIYIPLIWLANRHKEGS